MMPISLFVITIMMINDNNKYYDNDHVDNGYNDDHHHTQSESLQ